MPSKGGHRRLPHVVGPLRLPHVVGPRRVPTSGGPHRVPSKGGPLRLPHVAGPRRVPSKGGPLRLPTKCKSAQTDYWVMRATVVAPLKSTPIGIVRLLLRPMSFSNHETIIPLKLLPARQKQNRPKPKYASVPLLAQLTASGLWWLLPDSEPVGSYCLYEDRMRIATMYAAQIQSLFTMIHQEISRSLSNEVWEAHRSALQQIQPLSQMLELTIYLRKGFSFNHPKNRTFCLPFTHYLTYPEKRTKKGTNVSTVTLKHRFSLRSQYTRNLFESVWSAMRDLVQPDRTMVVWSAYVPSNPLPQAGSLVPLPSFTSTTFVKSFAVALLNGHPSYLWRFEVNSLEVPGLSIMNHLVGNGNFAKDFEWLVSPCYAHVTRVEQVAWDTLMNDNDLTLLRATNNFDYPAEIAVVHAKFVPAKKTTWKGNCLTLSPPTV